MANRTGPSESKGIPALVILAAFHAKKRRAAWACLCIRWQRIREPFNESPTWRAAWFDAYLSQLKEPGRVKIWQS